MNKGVHITIVVSASFPHLALGAAATDCYLLLMYALVPLFLLLDVTTFR